MPVCTRVAANDGCLLSVTSDQLLLTLTANPPLQLLLMPTAAAHLLPPAVPFGLPRNSHSPLSSSFHAARRPSP